MTPHKPGTRLSRSAIPVSYTHLIHSLQDALDKYRIGYVTENRKEEGLILDNTVGFSR